MKLYFFQRAEYDQQTQYTDYSPSLSNLNKLPAVLVCDFLTDISYVKDLFRFIWTKMYSSRTGCKA